jgi:transposase-like protein
VCGAVRIWEKKPPLFRCGNCTHDFTVISGTLFANTHKPLRMWFEALWYVTNQKSGTSALGLQRVLGMGSYRTAWSWMHKLRRAMVRPGRDCLSGVVEVDEAFIGGPRPGKRGRGAAGKTLVMVAAQANGKKIGRIRMARLVDASAASLLPAIKQSIEPGSCVQTDAWGGYNGLEKCGYHREVIHSTAELGENLLPKINLTVSLLKRWLLGTHQGAVRPQHLDYYLDEFTFRFNRRTSRSRGLLFYRLLEQAIALEPVRSKDLLGGWHTEEAGTTTSSA